LVYWQRLKLLVFFATDCPTCRLALPYLDALPNLTAISQDDQAATQALVRDLRLRCEVRVDGDLSLSRRYDPVAVPALYVLDEAERIVHQSTGFDKDEFNEIAALFGAPPVALPHDGNPAHKPGCSSRHRESTGGAGAAAPLDLYNRLGRRPERVALDDGADIESVVAGWNVDPLPVVPPAAERVDRMLAAVPLPADEVIGRIPPNYEPATLEHIAVAAVMAGCPPPLLQVLVPLVRAACDERFNLHGVQATTHFAAPLVIVNGPLRQELGFACGSNVFSNVARANSTVGRALQLLLTNLGGARPGEIDMSTLGSPGKFSYCIAENEEENPWTPLHVERGFARQESTVTLFAAEPPHGVSEHHAREARVILQAISRALATVWTYRACAFFEALVVLCPEHVKTLVRDGFGKDTVRRFLFENTGVPLRVYDEGWGEGSAMIQMFEQTTINGERCYRKFARPEQIHIVVAGGTAGKFSAVVGSWAAGPRGSQMVTYPCPRFS
jgi:hypothetical protein